MPYRHTLLFLLATLTTIDASAWSRMGTAAVMTEVGLPCFKIASEEERSRGPVSLRMLTISTPGPNGWNNAGTVMFPNASFGDPSYRLPNRGCVPYGKAPEGAESSDAAPLITGKVYGVSFLGRPPSASDPTSRYSADFCLLTAPAGGFGSADKWQEYLRSRGKTKIARVISPISIRPLLAFKAWAEPPQSIPPPASPAP